MGILGNIQTTIWISQTQHINIHNSALYFLIVDKLMCIYGKRNLQKKGAMLFLKVEGAFTCGCGTNCSADRNVTNGLEKALRLRFKASFFASIRPLCFRSEHKQSCMFVHISVIEKKTLFFVYLYIAFRGVTMSKKKRGQCQKQGALKTLKISQFLTFFG